MQLSSRDGDLRHTPGRVGIATHPRSKVVGLWITRINQGKRFAAGTADGDGLTGPFERPARGAYNTGGIVARRQSPRGYGQSKRCL